MLWVAVVEEVLSCVVFPVSDSHYLDKLKNFDFEEKEGRKLHLILKFSSK